MTQKVPVDRSCGAEMPLQVLQESQHNDRKALAQLLKAFRLK
jgi:hypothetical protein